MGKSFERMGGTYLVFTYVNTNYCSSIKVITLGREACKASKKNLEHFQKNHFTLHYVTSGKGTLNANGITYHLKRGDVFVIFPNQVVSYQQDPNDPWHYYWYEFGGKDAAEICKSSFFTLASPVYSTNQPYIFDELFTNMILETEQSPALEFYALSYLLRCFGLIAEERLIIEKNNNSIKNSHVEKILNFINEHYSDFDLSVPQIAREFHFSTSYVSKLFKDVMNVSVNKYIIDYRITKAISLMANKYLSVKQISQMVGYNDPYYFSKIFKKYSGSSPSRYIKYLTETNQYLNYEVKK